MDVKNSIILPELLAEHALQSKVEPAITRSDDNDLFRTKEVAREFTAILYCEVLKAMRAASPEEGLTETDRTSRDIYNSMMDSEMARVMAKHDATGLTKMVESSLRKTPHRKSTNESVLPASGVVTSRFGVRRDPIAKKLKFHEGIDIAAPAGAPVRAPISGRVSFSGKMAGYGNVVEVSHGNGLRTRYAHNSANLVSVGDYVRPGDTIALVGSTGRATGAHVHIEARRNGKPIDPSFLLRIKSKESELSIRV